MNFCNKRIFAAVLAASLLISGAACGNNTERNNTDDENVSEQGKDKAEEIHTDSSAAENDRNTSGSESSGLSEESTTDGEITKEQENGGAVEAIAEENGILKGCIYDANGKKIMYNRPFSDGTSRRVFSDDCAVPFANVVSGLSDGIDSRFENILLRENPEPVKYPHEVGQSVQLTFDSNVQNAIYNFMAECNIEGSVVVMRTDGSLMAEVSYPSYNPYYFEDNPDTGEDLIWGTYGNKALQPATPGSCFKIMSEVISEKNGIYSLIDEGVWTDDGSTVLDWDYDENPEYPMERSLYSAFLNSSNIFFAKSFSLIGTDTVVDDLNEIFHFNWDNDIECDFGTLSNNIEIYCDDDLRRSAFGQAYVLTTPVYLAALGREAIFGDMVRPFVLKNAVNTNDYTKVTEAGSKAYDIIAAIPYEYRQSLLDGMIGVANNIGLYVPPGYNVYAKTGTAETDDGDILYITGGVKHVEDNYYDQPDFLDYSSYWERGSYIIVMQIKNAEYFGFDFASQSAYLYQEIINLLVGY